MIVNVGNVGVALLGLYCIVDAAAQYSWGMLVTYALELTAWGAAAGWKCAGPTAPYVRRTVKPDPPGDVECIEFRFEGQTIAIVRMDELDPKPADNASEASWDLVVSALIFLAGSVVGAATVWGCP